MKGEVAIAPLVGIEEPARATPAEGSDLSSRQTQNVAKDMETYQLHMMFRNCRWRRPHPAPVGPVIPDLTTLWGFPCCARFPCVRAAASTPVQRPGVVFAHLTQPYQPSPKLRSGRPAHRPFRGLLSVHSRCGPHTCAVTNT